MTFELSLMTLKRAAKFEEKQTTGSKNDMRNLANFQRVLEGVKIGTLMGFFCPNQKIYELKFTEELWIMTLKNDKKIQQELTCLFKIDTRNLTNFDLST